MHLYRCMYYFIYLEINFTVQKQKIRADKPNNAKHNRQYFKQKLKKNKNYENN